MLSKNLILRSITKFIAPFIVFFALYVQINGEVSPGGGFQAGSIFASIIIGLSLVFDKFRNYYEAMRTATSAGVIIYAITGLIPIFLGYNYLNYYALANDPQSAQKMGIFIIEVGVGLTVSAGIMLIYFLIDEDKT